MHQEVQQLSTNQKVDSLMPLHSKDSSLPQGILASPLISAWLLATVIKLVLFSPVIKCCKNQLSVVFCRSRAISSRSFSLIIVIAAPRPSRAAVNRSHLPTLPSLPLKFRLSYTIQTPRSQLRSRSPRSSFHLSGAPGPSCKAEGERAFAVFAPPSIRSAESWILYYGALWVVR